MITISFQNLAKTFDILRRMRSGDPLKYVAGRLAFSMVRYARQQTPVLSGDTKEGWASSIRTIPGGYAVALKNTNRSAKLLDYLEHGTSPHMIQAKRGSIIRFETTGGKVVFTRTVMHPGTKALHILDKTNRYALAEVDRLAKEWVGGL